MPNERPLCRQLSAYIVVIQNFYLADRIEQQPRLTKVVEQLKWEPVYILQ